MSFLESEKLDHETYKHLTILSTGSIVLLVGMVEKLFSTPEWKLLIAFSLSSFVVCVVISVCGMFLSASYVEYGEEARGKIPWLENIVIFGAPISYLIGVTSFAVFSIKNLF